MSVLYYQTNDILLADGTYFSQNDIKNGNSIYIKNMKFTYDNNMDGIVGFYDYSMLNNISISTFTTNAYEVEIMKCKFVLPDIIKLYSKSMKDWIPIKNCLKDSIFAIINKSIITSIGFTSTRFIGPKEFIKISDKNVSYIIVDKNNDMIQLPVSI